MKEILPFEFRCIQRSYYRDFYILETKEECYEIANSEFEIVEKTYKYTSVEDDFYCIVLFSRSHKKVTIFTCDRIHEFEIDFRNFNVDGTCGSKIFIKAYEKGREALIVVGASDGKLNYIDGCTRINCIDAIDTYYIAEINGKYYVYILDDLTLVRVKDFEPCNDYSMGDNLLSVRRGRRYYIYNATSMELKFKGNKLSFSMYIHRNKLSFF